MTARLAPLLFARRRRAGLRRRLGVLARPGGRRRLPRDGADLRLVPRRERHRGGCREPSLDQRDRRPRHPGDLSRAGRISTPAPRTTWRKMDELPDARQSTVCWDMATGEELWRDDFPVAQTDIPSNRVGWALAHRGPGDRQRLRPHRRRPADLLFAGGRAAVGEADVRAVRPHQRVRRADDHADRGRGPGDRLLHRQRRLRPRGPAAAAAVLRLRHPHRRRAVGLHPRRPGRGHDLHEPRRRGDRRGPAAHQRQRRRRHLEHRRPHRRTALGLPDEQAGPERQPGRRPRRPRLHHPRRGQHRHHRGRPRPRAVPRPDPRRRRPRPRRPHRRSEGVRLAEERREGRLHRPGAARRDPLRRHRYRQVGGLRRGRRRAAVGVHPRHRRQGGRRSGRTGSCTSWRSPAASGS